MKTAILLIDNPAASADPVELAYLINLAEEIKSCGHSVEFVCGSTYSYSGGDERSFELGEHPEHAKHGLAFSCGRVDGLLVQIKANPCGLEI